MGPRRAAACHCPAGKFFSDRVDPTSFFELVLELPDKCILFNVQRAWTTSVIAPTCVLYHPASPVLCSRRPTSLFRRFAPLLLWLHLRARSLSLTLSRSPGLDYAWLLFSPTMHVRTRVRASVSAGRPRTSTDPSAPSGTSSRRSGPARGTSPSVTRSSRLCSR